MKKIISLSLLLFYFFGCSASLTNDSPDLMFENLISKDVAQKIPDKSRFILILQFTIA